VYVYPMCTVIKEEKSYISLSRLRNTTLDRCPKELAAGLCRRKRPPSLIPWHRLMETENLRLWPPQSALVLSSRYDS